MNESIIIAIIAGVLILAYVVLTIVKTKKSKSAKEQHQAKKLPPLIPKYIGKTADSKNDFHDPRVMQYSLQIDKPTGPAIAFAHEELTSVEALKQMFKFDRANNIEILSDEAQASFIALAESYDRDGWLEFDRSHLPPANKFKVSSCCKAYLPVITNENDSGAFRCPTCHKFCKAI